MRPVNCQTVMNMITGSAVLDWAEPGLGQEAEADVVQSPVELAVAANICRNTGAMSPARAPPA